MSCFNFEVEVSSIQRNGVIQKAILQWSCYGTTPISDDW